jgi:hypothetical protein
MSRCGGRWAAAARSRGDGDGDAAVVGGVEAQRLHLLLDGPHCSRLHWQLAPPDHRTWRRLHWPGRTLGRIKSNCRRIIQGVNPFWVSHTHTHTHTHTHISALFARIGTNQTNHRSQVAGPGPLHHLPRIGIGLALRSYPCHPMDTSTEDEGHGDGEDRGREGPQLNQTNHPCGSVATPAQREERRSTSITHLLGTILALPSLG